MTEFIDRETGEVQPATLTGQSFQEAGSPEQIAKLYGALAKAQAAFAVVKRNKKVTIKSDKGAYSFDYAPLEELTGATRKALTDQGLAILTPMVRSGDHARVMVILTHADGGRLAAAWEFVPTGDMKQMGGQVTYLRRYGYGALLNLAGDDDADDTDAPLPDQKRQPNQRPAPRAPAPVEKAPEGEIVEAMRERQAPALEPWKGIADEGDPVGYLNRATAGGIDDYQSAPDSSGPATDDQKRRYVQLMADAQELDLDVAPFEIDAETITRARIIELGTRLKSVIDAKRARAGAPA